MRSSIAVTVTQAAVNGVAIFDNLVINSDGEYTLTASDGGLVEATSQSFTIVGPATKLGFTQQPTCTLAGNVMTPRVTVAVQDSLGYTIRLDNSTVTLTLSSGTFAGDGTTATATAVNGVATFNNLILTGAGDYTIIASDDSLTPATSSGFTTDAPPRVLSINRETPTGPYTDALSVTYAVTFSEPVTGVTYADFQLSITGATTASYTVVVSPRIDNLVYDVKLLVRRN